MRSKRHALLSFYTLSGLRRFQLTNALWILYLLHVGWSLWQVGLAEAGFHLVSLLSDLPTGAFADRYGRRLSMAVGLSIGAVTTLSTYFLAPISPWAGGVSVALGALEWTFVGGADVALLNGILTSETNEPRSFSRGYSYFLQIGFISTAAASALGGVLVSHNSWEWPFLGTALSLLAALLLVPNLPAEHPVPGGLVRPAAGTLGVVLRQTAATVKRDGLLARLIVFGAALATLVTINNLYAQSTLAAKHLPLVWITALVALANVVSAIGAAVGGRLEGSARGRDTGQRWLAGGTTLLGLAVGLFGTMTGAWSVTAYLGAAGLDGLIDPVYETALNRAAPEAVRATILSAPGTGFSLGMIVLFPLAGWLMTRYGIPLTYAALAFLLLLLSWTAWVHTNEREATGEGRQ